MTCWARYGRQGLMPAYQLRSGGASSVASFCSSRSGAWGSAASTAAMSPSSSSRWRGWVSWVISSATGLMSSSRARARCSALLTATTDMSSSSATSVAGQPSTSRRISTARCRGGRYCRLATRARRTLSRVATMDAGSASSSQASGNGCSQAMLGSTGPAASALVTVPALPAPSTRGGIMRKLTVSTLVSLDGVFQDPGGFGETDQGGWAGPFFNDAAAQDALERLLASDYFLIGRVTY